jgi:hypothetical protein
MRIISCKAKKGTNRIALTSAFHPIVNPEISSAIVAFTSTIFGLPWDHLSRRAQLKSIYSPVYHTEFYLRGLVVKFYDRIYFRLFTFYRVDFLITFLATHLPRATLLNLSGSLTWLRILRIFIPSVEAKIIDAMWEIIKM